MCGNLLFTPDTLLFLSALQKWQLRFFRIFFFFCLFVFSVHNFPRLHITQLFLVLYGLSVGFPGDSVVKNLPAMQETRVRSLGREDPLEEGIVTHSNILA